MPTGNIASKLLTIVSHRVTLLGATQGEASFDMACDV